LQIIRWAVSLAFAITESKIFIVLATPIPLFCQIKIVLSVNKVKPVKKRRSNLEVIRQTLLVASGSEGCSKTEIVYQTRSTFVRAGALLSLLVGQDLLQKSARQGIQIYKITSKGKEVTQAIELISSALTANRSSLYQDGSYGELNKSKQVLE